MPCLHVGVHVPSTVVTCKIAFLGWAGEIGRGQPRYAFVEHVR